MRDTILATATALFVQRGYEGVAMREIAEACGITKAALYYHFAGKADVLDAVFTGYLDEIATVVEDGLAHGSAEQRLRRLVEGLFGLPSERRAIMRLAMHDVAHLEPERRSAFATNYRARFIGPLKDLLAEGMDAGEFRPGDPSVVVWVLLGMLYPFFAPPGSAAVAGDRQVAEVLDVFLHGLCA